MTNYDPNNIFAKIIRGEIPATKVYEDDQILAFNDISRAAPTHVLVIPKGQFINFADFISKANDKEIVDFFKKVSDIAKSLNLTESGYRLISNTGPNASQSVQHFHVHLIGGKKLGGLIPGDNNVR
jgi:diadenosine tetraphosphate (Ap4A) HIT family hydrolase